MSQPPGGVSSVSVSAVRKNCRAAPDPFPVRGDRRYVGKAVAGTLYEPGWGAIGDRILGFGGAGRPDSPSGLPRSASQSYDAHDAFHATFLVLVHKARGLWVQDSLGPGLHRVAKRFASRSRESTRRRRQSERRAAELRPDVVPATLHAQGVSAILHEETDRLPDWYRFAVVLCHLEALSRERAASALSVPIGTVKSRLHRARDLIRERLSRRGLTFSTALLTAGAASKSLEASLPLSLIDSLIRAEAPACIHRARESGLISARAFYLVEEVI
jgi:DNA-directed RNA polymerase specialized sigma24 family protein